MARAPTRRSLAGAVIRRPRAVFNNEMSYAHSPDTRGGIQLRIFLLTLLSRPIVETGWRRLGRRLEWDTRGESCEAREGEARLDTTGRTNSGT
jgi:hypothetical protein